MITNAIADIKTISKECINECQLIVKEIVVFLQNEKLSGKNCVCGGIFGAINIVRLSNSTAKRMINFWFYRLQMINLKHILNVSYKKKKLVL